MTPFEIRRPQARAGSAQTQPARRVRREPFLGPLGCDSADDLLAEVGVGQELVDECGDDVLSGDAGEAEAVVRGNGRRAGHDSARAFSVASSSSKQRMPTVRTNAATSIASCSR